MRLPWSPIVCLLLLLLTACVASHPEERPTVRSSALTPGLERPAPDRILTRGDIQVAEERLKIFGVDPGPVDGICTAQTQAAVRAFQVRYVLPVSGLLDRATREQLQIYLEPMPSD